MVITCAICGKEIEGFESVYWINKFKGCKISHLDCKLELENKNNVTIKKGQKAEPKDI